MNDVYPKVWEAGWSRSQRSIFLPSSAHPMECTFDRFPPLFYCYCMKQSLQKRLCAGDHPRPWCTVLYCSTYCICQRGLFLNGFLSQPTPPRVCGGLMHVCAPWLHRTRCLLAVRYHLLTRYLLLATCDQEFPHSYMKPAKMSLGYQSTEVLPFHNKVRIIG
jgi:hypothetical protein